jgi:hypothetical protein
MEILRVDECLIAHREIITQNPCIPNNVARFKHRKTYGAMNRSEIEIPGTPVKSAFFAFKQLDSFHFVTGSLYSSTAIRPSASSPSEYGYIELKGASL